MILKLNLLNIIEKLSKMQNLGNFIFENLVNIFIWLCLLLLKQHPNIL
jgi:hypothetical protein